MSVFLETNHLFLRAPGGGVTGADQMKAAGFGAIFCNIKDFMPEEWEEVRHYADRAGVVCGPWSRMCAGGPGDEYDRIYLDNLLACAEDWGNVPYIVNGEDELNHRDEVSREIVAACGSDDWALSMIAWPFNDNDWSMFKVPILPQLFGPDWADTTQAGLDCISKWKSVSGGGCCVPTYGSYSQWQPSLYRRLSPYGVYTADDCGGNYAPWGPTGVTNPCMTSGYIPPTNGDDMEKIGYQNGVTASVNRMRDLDPKGTLLVKTGGKWPSIDTLDQPVDQWKAYDKLERTLTILVNDHDGAV